ncbi:MAG TPA: hypothetical protein VGR47_12635 [Terracidiphilus sp.]|nr:hypothetical protein [Terracidiphilus sp.]
MILYRPMDIEELRLLYETGMKGFPARKPEQPIFYPVLNLEYANEIAKRWNAEGQTRSGYVAKFTVDDSYAAQFERRTVGASHHVELWVPAEELPRFNDHILPPIVIVSAHFGGDFHGYVPTQYGLRGKDASAQFVALARTLDYSPMDFRGEIAANHIAIFLNYGFWRQHAFSNEHITKAEHDRVLNAIQKIWTSMFPEIELPLTFVS